MPREKEHIASWPSSIHLSCSLHRTISPSSQNALIPLASTFHIHISHLFLLFLTRTFLHTVISHNLIMSSVDGDGFDSYRPAWMATASHIRRGLDPETNVDIAREDPPTVSLDFTPSDGVFSGQISDFGRRLPSSSLMVRSRCFDATHH